MRLLQILASLFKVVFVTSISLFQEESFMVWYKQHNSSYNKSYEDLINTWIDNDNYINYINSQNYTYKLGHNHFSGMNSVEFSEYMNFYNNRQIILTQRRLNKYLNIVNLSTNYPTSLDWTSNGAVTSVKNQGQCGSCWTFSTVGAVEGYYYIKNHLLVDLSEQQLLDCDNVNQGCNGGSLQNAYRWILTNKGLCTYASYPYLAKKSSTCSKCLVDNKSKINAYVSVSPNNDINMITALLLNPVSVSIEASQQAFQLYKSGVFTQTCGVKLDHGVLLVGYGIDNLTNYYKIKNSWSRLWGENGYIRIGRGSQYNNGAGQCGVLMNAVYPI